MAVFNCRGRKSAPIDPHPINTSYIFGGDTIHTQCTEGSKEQTADDTLQLQNTPRKQSCITKNSFMLYTLCLKVITELTPKNKLPSK